MEFKNFEFRELGTGYWEVRLPFGMEIAIRTIDDKFRWDLDNAYTTFKHGYSTTLEGAKKNSQKAFKKYIENHLQKCLID